MTDPGVLDKPVPVRIEHDVRSVAAHVEGRRRLELAKVVLGNAGAEVRTTTSGRDATDVLAGWPADVLVLDIEMPVEDGYALLRRIRESDAPGQRTPAIALTAYASGEDRKRAFEAGFDCHFTKPVDPEQLEALVACPERFRTQTPPPVEN